MELLNAQLIPIESIEPNEGQIEGLPRNPRFIRDDKFEALKRSILENPEMLGFRELLVYPFEGKYIAIGGNMRLAAMRDLGYREAPCKILPEELDAKALRAITMKDNYGYGEWDSTILAEEWDMSELDAWDMSDIAGFDPNESEEEKDVKDLTRPSTEENPYTTIVNSPIYEIKGECPSLSELYDNSKSISLIEKIDKSNVPDEIKMFLRICAMRHTVINFGAVAEYYAHADKEVQELFEDNALVIIDFNKAIENGYAVLRKDIMDIYEKNKSLNEQFDYEE